MQIGEIAASAARHQDLLADLVGTLQHQHATAPAPGHKGTHQAGRTAADNDHIELTHGRSLVA